MGLDSTPSQPPPAEGEPLDPQQATSSSNEAASVMAVLPGMKVDEGIHVNSLGSRPARKLAGAVGFHPAGPFDSITSSWTVIHSSSLLLQHKWPALPASVLASRLTAASTNISAGCCSMLWTLHPARAAYQRMLFCHYNPLQARRPRPWSHKCRRLQGPVTR
jgi:hypothetical protein